MLVIRFTYQGDDYSLAREIVSTRLCESISTIIALPNEIEIRFANLGKSVYGAASLEHRFKNRIAINNTLTVREIPEVLVHELIHLHQIHIGLLSVSRTGIYSWKNKQYKINNPKTMTVENHNQLPWEVDVAIKQQTVLSAALAHATKNK
jgi:hypothetical protein